MGKVEAYQKPSATWQIAVSMNDWTIAHPLLTSDGRAEGGLQLNVCPLETPLEVVDDEGS